MTMIASHNEASNWIAKHLSGSLELFVQRMNDRAQELGMCHTFFSNPSGLPAVIDELDNSSSPHDLLILSLEIIRHGELMKICSMPYAEVSNGKKPFQIRNHNGLVREYTGEIDGIKTGYTKSARFCLVAASSRSGYRLVSIILGVSNTYLRNAIVADMMNAYYETLTLSGLGDTNIIDRSFVSTRLDSLNKKLITQAIRKDPSSVETSNLTQAFDLVPITVRKVHKVRSGDNLSKLAQKYRCTVTDIKKWNKLRSNTIKVGQKLAIFHKTVKKIPVKVDPKQKLDPEIDVDTKDEEVPEEKNHESGLADTTIDTSSQPQPFVPEPKKEFIYHTVQRGDTLWGIVQRYQGTDIKQVMKINNISDANTIKVGMKLKIPKS
jgi:D-alanyl-D-alanine carboxypeptidase